MQNFIFLACLEVAEKFGVGGVGWGGVVLGGVGWCGLAVATMSNLNPS